MMFHAQHIAKSISVAFASLRTWVSFSALVTGFFFSFFPFVDGKSAPDASVPVTAEHIKILITSKKCNQDGQPYGSAPVALICSFAGYSFRRNTIRLEQYNINPSINK